MVKKDWEEITAIIDLNKRVAHLEAEIERKRRPVSIMPENGRIHGKTIVALTVAISALAAVIAALIKLL